MTDALTLPAVAAAAVLILASACASPPPPEAPASFEPRGYSSGSEVMPYRLFIPAGYDKQRRYPLVLWLHGVGGRGTDNAGQIAGDQVLGTHVWTTADNQRRHPAFVVVPQSSTARWSDGGTGRLSHDGWLAIGIVEALAREFSIDPHRVYVAGQSMGGVGTFAAIADRPDLFAAAIPLCAFGGSPERAEAMAAVPIWVFQGDKDSGVDTSHKMIAALEKAGAHPRYTEYKDVGHDVWTRAFAEPDLVDWLFAQHK